MIYRETRRVISMFNKCLKEIFKTTRSRSGGQVLFVLAAAALEIRSEGGISSEPEKVQ